MAGTTSQHVFEFIGKVDSLEKASKATATSMGKIETATKKVGDVAKFALAGVGVAAVGQFVGASVKMAVAAEDAGTKFDAVFGPNVQAASAFVEEFANKAGFAEFEMQGMLATTANVAQGLGATGDEALTLSTDLATMAGDVASFNGATSETPAVLAAMQSALTGEREALKTYGIVIDEADVNTQAMIETGKTQVDQLTKVEKAQATLTLITERAGAAVGDLDATADSTSNQMAKLGAEFKDVQVQLGTGLIPVLTVGLGLLSDMTGALLGTADAADSLESSLSRGSVRLQSFLGLADSGEKAFLAAADGVAHFNQETADGEGHIEALAESLVGVIKLAGPEGAAAAVGALAQETETSNLRLQDAADLAVTYAEELGLTSEELEILTGYTSEAQAAIEDQIASWDSGTAEAQRFAQIGLGAAEDATEDLTAATENTTTALQDYAAEQRKMTDPLFAYTQATRDLDTAIQDVDVARRDFGRGSPEHVEAMESQATAYADVRDAAEVLRQQGINPTKDAFRQMATQAGLTDEQIRLMEQQWDLWNPASKKLELLPTGGGWTIEAGGSEFRAKGGPVKAGESYIVGEGGEPEVFVPGAHGYVTPVSKLPTTAGTAVGGGGGFTQVIVVNLNQPVVGDRALQDIVVSSITHAQQRGRLPKPDRQDVAPVKRQRTA